MYKDCGQTLILCSSFNDKSSSTWPSLTHWTSPDMIKLHTKKGLFLVTQTAWCSNKKTEANALLLISPEMQYLWPCVTLSCDYQGDTCMPITCPRLKSTQNCYRSSRKCDHYLICCCASWVYSMESRHNTSPILHQSEHNRRALQSHTHYCPLPI